MCWLADVIFHYKYGEMPNITQKFPTPSIHYIESVLDLKAHHSKLFMDIALGFCCYEKHFHGKEIDFRNSLIQPSNDCFLSLIMYDLENIWFDHTKNNKHIQICECSYFMGRSAICVCRVTTITFDIICQNMLLVILTSLSKYHIESFSMSRS